MIIFVSLALTTTCVLLDRTPNQPAASPWDEDFLSLSTVLITSGLSEINI